MIKRTIAAGKGAGALATGPLFFCCVVVVFSLARLNIPTISRIFRLKY